MKYFLLIVFLWVQAAYGQVVDSSQCSNTIGAGQINVQCTLNTMDTVFTGQWTTQCVTFNTYDNNIHLSYIFVNGICPPGTNYTSLTINVWNETCDTILYSGLINSGNGWDLHLNMDTARNYVICYTWKALCTQFAMCPVITTSAVPVNLLYFRATDKNGGVMLAWATASEINSEAFYIQKDNDIIWYEKGSGTTSEENTYVFYDSEPRTCYYTLMQKDYNGMVEKLKTIRYENKYKSEVCLYWDMVGSFCGIDYSKLKQGVYVKNCGGLSELVIK